MKRFRKIWDSFWLQDVLSEIQVSEYLKCKMIDRQIFCYLDKDENKAFLNDEKKAERTKSLLRTAFVVASLSFHSVIAGLTLGLEKETSGVWINFGAIAMHKFVIAFSVGVELVTSGVSF